MKPMPVVFREENVFDDPMVSLMTITLLTLEQLNVATMRSSVVRARTNPHAPTRARTSQKEFGTGFLRW